MFDVILKTTNSYFQRGMLFCLSIYMKDSYEATCIHIGRAIVYTCSFTFAVSSYLSGKNYLSPLKWHQHKETLTIFLELQTLI